jgi:hypothetical protein
LKTIAESQKKTVNQVMLQLERHYNGYKYNVEAETTLFNAFVIQNFFNSQGLLKLRDYFTESGGTQTLLKSLNQQAIPDLRKYLDVLSNPSSRLQIPLKELSSPKDWTDLQKDFKQNALDAGYLTIDKVAFLEEEEEYIVDLKIPNNEVFQNMKALLKKFLIRNDKFGDILPSLEQKNFKNFFESLETVVFRDKSFLNLHDKDHVIRKDANYEILLHQIIAMVLRFTIEVEKKKNIMKDYVLENEKLVNEKKRLDMFIGIKPDLGILLEFGMKRSGKNPDKSIEAIFDENKKYYQIFNEIGVQYNENFVIGVEMDSVSMPIITDFKVLKLKEKGKIEKREDWLEFP